MLKKLEQYQKIEKIGEGTYGKVYKAKYLEDKQFYAIKKIKMEESDEGIPSTALREISILKILNHPNIVQIKDVIYIPNKLYLILEYLPHTLNCDENFSVQQKKSILFQLLEGVHYLHKKKIYHRDIKPQNILIKDGNIKLADFGLCRPHSFNQQLTSQIQSLFYRAPEILLGGKYDGRADVWSLGCIFLELHMQQVLFQGQCEIEILFKQFQLFGTPDNYIWPGIEDFERFSPNWPQWSQQNFDYFGDMQQLVVGMMQLCPEKRFTCEQALRFILMMLIETMDDFFVVIKLNFSFYAKIYNQSSSKSELSLSFRFQLIYAIIKISIIFVIIIITLDLDLQKKLFTFILLIKIFKELFSTQTCYHFLFTLVSFLQFKNYKRYHLRQVFIYLKSILFQVQFLFQYHLIEFIYLFIAYLKLLFFQVQFLLKYHLMGFIYLVILQFGQYDSQTK